MRPGKYFARWVDTLNTRVGESAAYLLLPLMAIVLLDVVLRYIFNRPTIWAWDVNIQLQAALAVLVAGYTLLLGRFVGVDVVVERLSPKAKARLDVITSVVVFFGMGILLWQAGTEAWYSLLTRERYTSLLSPPIYPLRIVVAIGVLLLFLQAVSRFIHDLTTLTGKQGNET